MKQKLLKIIFGITSISTIISSVIHLITKKGIPGFSMFSLSISMFCWIFITKKQFDEGKISKGNWNSNLYIGIMACAMGVILGISEIIVAVKK